MAQSSSTEQQTPIQDGSTSSVAPPKKKPRGANNFPKDEVVVPEGYEPLPAKRKPGRPKKSEIEAAKKKKSPTQLQRIREFKARLVVTHGPKIIEKIVTKAMDDKDPDQAAMLKMCFDRLLPVASFAEKGAGQSGAIVQVNVGLADPSQGVLAEQKHRKVKQNTIDDAEEVDFVVTEATP